MPYSRRLLLDLWAGIRGVPVFSEPGCHIKVQWAKMNAVKLTTEGPPVGKEHRTSERYFDEVLEVPAL